MTKITQIVQFALLKLHFTCDPFQLESSSFLWLSRTALKHPYSLYFLTSGKARFSFTLAMKSQDVIQLRLNMKKTSNDYHSNSKHDFMTACSALHPATKKTVHLFFVIVHPILSLTLTPEAYRLNSD